jgi:putative AdoMet-dependent methyltransferase
VTDLYKEKAESYDAEDWEKVLSSVAGAMILSKVPFHDQMHVMDFGAGTGLICSHVAPMVKKITAVDISEAMLKKLAAKPELKNKVNALCQDIMNTPINEKFDLIMSAFAMHHVEDTNNLIQTFAAHLEPGSWIALVDVDKEDGSFHSEDNQGVFHCGFDRDALKAILKKYSFENINFVTAHHFEWDSEKYSAFLVTALKG